MSNHFQRTLIQFFHSSCLFITLKLVILEQCAMMTPNALFVEQTGSFFVPRAWDSKTVLVKSHSFNNFINVQSFSKDHDSIFSLELPFYNPKIGNFRTVCKWRLMHFSWSKPEAFSSLVLETSSKIGASKISFFMFFMHILVG